MRCAEISGICKDAPASPTAVGMRLAHCRRPIREGTIIVLEKLAKQVQSPSPCRLFVDYLWIICGSFVNYL